MDRNYSPTGAYRLEGEDAQERRPSRSLNALGEMMVLDLGADLQVLMIARVVFTQQRERHLVVKVGALPLHLQMRLHQQCDGRAPPVTALLPPGHTPLGHLSQHDRTTGGGARFSTPLLASLLASSRQESRTAVYSLP
jgi:hypothetical protein